MGVPKFFRWLSERYPNILQRVNVPSEMGHNNSNNRSVRSKLHVDGAENIPPIDRLYLDLNGVLHGCAHNNSSSSDSSEKPISEILELVEIYLDRIVCECAGGNVKLLYIAVDGVAPRAKLNQQRARRYKAAVEASEGGESQVAKEYESIRCSRTGVLRGKIEKMIHLPAPSESVSLNSTNKNDENDSTEMYQTNSITPGTEFLHQVSVFLEELVEKKIQSGAWGKDICVVLNGADVPGEGEHKIMDFMRQQQYQYESNLSKSELEHPNLEYKPDLSHCIMSQDGDLVMLGLACKERNMLLLREKVYFPQKSNRAKDIDENDYNNELDPLEGKKLDSTWSRTDLSPQEYVHNTNFEFLYLHLLKDYLYLELDDEIKCTQRSALELEHHKQSLADDFVFLTFLVGNDFIPPLPSLDIGEGGLDQMLMVYKSHREKWERQFTERDPSSASEDYELPYLTYEGEIVSFDRLFNFLEEVANRNERPYYRKRKNHYDYSIDPLSYTTRLHTPEQRLIAGKRGEEDEGMFGSITSMIWESLSFFKPPQEMENNVENEECPNTTKPRRLSHLRKYHHQDLKMAYYADKFGFYPTKVNFDSRNNPSFESVETQNIIEDEDVKKSRTNRLTGMQKNRLQSIKDVQSNQFRDEVRQICEEYVKGLLWCMKYYHSGVSVCGWEWYYPYHYAPMVSDLTQFHSRNLTQLSPQKRINFESFQFPQGAPFPAFLQLLATLPPHNLNLLPKSYRQLLIEVSTSNLSGGGAFSEENPETKNGSLEIPLTLDFNGKRNHWESVVLLPFLNPRLMESLRSKVSYLKLDSQEKTRTGNGVAHLFFQNHSNNNNNNIAKFVYDCNGESYLSDAKFVQLNNLTPKDHHLFRSQLVNQQQMPSILSGLFHSETQVKLLRLGLNIHGTKSKYNTLRLSFEAPLDLSDDCGDDVEKGDMNDFNLSKEHNNLVDKLVGQVVLYNFPYTKEGFVVNVQSPHKVIDDPENITSSCYLKTRGVNFTFKDVGTKKKPKANSQTFESMMDEVLLDILPYSHEENGVKYYHKKIHTILIAESLHTAVKTVQSEAEWYLDNHEIDPELLSLVSDKGKLLNFFWKLKVDQDTNYRRVDLGQSVNNFVEFGKVGTKSFENLPPIRDDMKVLSSTLSNLRQMEAKMTAGKKQGKVRSLSYGKNNHRKTNSSSKSLNFTRRTYSTVGAPGRDLSISKTAIFRTERYVISQLLRFMK